MKKYIALRILFVIFMSLLASLLVYYLISLAMIMKWSGPAPFGDYVDMAWINLKTAVINVVKYQNFGVRANNESKFTYVFLRVPISLKINLIAFAIYTILGMTLGILTALFKDTWFDHLMSWFTLVFGSLPTYIVVFFLMMVFGFGLHWVPTLFMWGGPIDRYIIPVLSIMLYPLAQIIRILRSEIIEGLDSNQVLLLKTKGLNRRQMVTRHLFRESLVTVLPQLSELFVFALLMSFIVEKTYQIPGVAKLFLDSIVSGGADGNFIYVDPMYTSLITMFYVLLILSINLLLDSSRSLLDPRISNK